MVSQAKVYCTSRLAFQKYLQRKLMTKAPFHNNLFFILILCIHPFCSTCASRLKCFFLLCSISFLVMSCGMPVAPVNGSIVGQDFSLGAKVTYQCNAGFRLAGPITTLVTCQESGRWSSIEAPPRCVRKYCYVSFR